MHRRATCAKTAAGLLMVTALVSAVRDKAVLPLDALAQWFLLGGAAVAVPLALALVEPAGAAHGRWRIARLTHVPAAAALCASNLMPPGTTAGWLGVPYLAFTLLIAMLGILRGCERGTGPASELVGDAGLVFLAVGGVATTASRFGGVLLGFGEPWLALTGVHFHFAGLVLPVVTMRLAREAPGALASAAALGVGIGVPFVALGIVTTARGVGIVEPAAALLLLAAALAVVVLLGRAAARRRGLERMALAGAAASLGAGIALSTLYVLGNAFARPWMTIPTMLQTHAPLNALGFALLALLALRSSAQVEPRPGMEILVTPLGDEPRVGLWETRAIASVQPQPGDVEDLHTVELGTEPPGPAEPQGPFARAAEALLSYRVFPERMLAPLVPRTPVEVGDTLRARYRLAPAVHLVFGARVVARIDDEAAGERSIGFTYRTLEGHPLCGEETFVVNKHLASGTVRLLIRARSRPATPLVRLLYPLVRRLQTRAGRAAVAGLAVSTSR